MSDAIVKTEAMGLAPIQSWTPEQKELIKRTVAPSATDDELSMFLHIAARSGLDPLRRQIHFLKVGGRVAVIADVNGLQARAAREPDFEGLLHAVVYEKDEFHVDNTSGKVLKHTHNPLAANGRIIGAWATVHRKGMLPFTSIVRFSEYDNGNNPLWKSKPGVMIDKVAKSTALRLAYPEQLGGIYERAELDQDEKEINAPPASPVVTGKRLAEVKAQMVAAKVAKLKPGTLVDVKPGETEEQAETRAASPGPVPTPWDEIQRMMAKAGKSGADAASFLKGATGKTTRAALVAEDVEKVRNALGAVGVDTSDEPPPFSDDDAPGDLGT